MFKKLMLSLLSLTLAFPIALPSVTKANTSDVQHNQELWSAVKPLDTITSFLNTGAHPDDERSHLLAYLSRGLGVHTASLIANRGEGGQNEIGEELGNGLGIIRSREMIEASKVTGVKVFHLSETTSDEIYDFGFSKAPGDTLSKWGEELTYERFIRRIRTYKPDIVMPSFRDVESQHGHHRAITRLSLKAFEDAADPTVFPEQLEEGLTTWQIKKLYLPTSKEQATLGIEIGAHDPVYDMTYPQLGEKSRYLHKSQGMGNEVEPGSRIEYLELIKSAVGDIPEQEESLFEGLPYDFEDYAASLKKSDNKIKGALKQVQKELEEVVDAYPSSSKVLKETHEALDKLRKAKKKVEKFSFKNVDKTDLLHRLDVKEEQLQEASTVAAGLEVTTSVEKPVLAQGTEAIVTIELSNNGDKALKQVTPTLNTPDGWKVDGDANAIQLDPGEKKTVEFSVKVPEDAPYYNPYDESVLSTEVSYRYGKEEVSSTFQPEETVAVLPEVGLKANPETLAVNTAQPREAMTFDITVTNYTHASLEANVGLQLPDGWEEVQEKSVAFHSDETEKTVSFTITPPEQLTDEPFKIVPTAIVNGKEIKESVQVISYDHIGTFYNIQPADVKGVAFNLKFPEDKKIGYVESGFDQVAEKLSEVGMDITKIEDLSSADLSQFDTVVTGIRAYLSRADLVEHNQKLLDYAKSGGHVVVQYNKPWDNWNAETTAPYPLTIGQPSIEWRVTDEASEYNILKPEHELFNQPNVITDKDWDGWIQERGLYYPMEWSSEYETFLTMTDLDGDQFEGGILLADYGEGSYIYTNLVWYRQIQNLVPGGYRIFSNLVSYDGE
ncbi:NEW3 domain-containing protein [Radiobacillus kanasensis]|uniref:NEW3 domain-containing protein n=1 Tax=Radiobacillus kanasensis TaxID=2844358 RepID=UPI001E34B2F6|nr:NEW3 domain-containing protein [Radiobacillus kanasensis]UFT98812.1 NEW3 domain-containing protein [Radiobacillus kanasensis]